MRTLLPAVLLLFPPAFGKVLTGLSPAEPSWVAINDGVMGGRSQGGPLQLEGGILRFAGIISLENNGGFSSIRSNDPRYALPGDGEIVLKLRGDGRSYWMDLRGSVRQGGSSYRAGFRTIAGEDWQEVRIPLSAFRASAYGMDLPGAPPLEPARVVSIGFTLYDKKAGPFRVDFDEIRFEPAPAPALPGPDASPVSDLIGLAIRRGVPLFNQGQPQACAAVYEVTAHALLRLPDDALRGGDREILAAALRAFGAEPNASEKAWILRRALDAVYPAHAAPPMPR